MIGNIELRIARLSCALALCAILAACTQTIHSCPPVPTWTPEASAELADEIETLPSTYDMIHRALIEAKTMRDQARLCRGS